MDLKRLEQLQVIEDEILHNTDASCYTIINASKLAEEDDYLYNLLVDWMKSNVELDKALYLDEILSYTDEMLRKMGIT